MSQELGFVEACLSMLKSLSASDETLLPSPGIHSPLAELNLRDINAVSFMKAIRERPLSNDAQVLLIRLYERVLIKLKGASMEKFAQIQRRWGSARRRALPRMEQLFKLQCQLAATRMQDALLGIIDERLKNFQDAANEPTDAHRGHSPKAVAILEKAFEHAPNITQAEKYKLAEATGLQPRQVTIWVCLFLTNTQFQNRRNRRSHTRRSTTVESSPAFSTSKSTLGSPSKSSLNFVKSEIACEIDAESDFGFEYQEGAIHSESEHDSQPMSKSDVESDYESDGRSQIVTEIPTISLPVLPSVSESSSDPIHTYVDAEACEDNVLDVWSSSMPVTSILEYSSMSYPSTSNSDNHTHGPAAVLFCGGSSQFLQTGHSASLDDEGQYLVFSPVDSMPRLDFADLNLNIDALEECFGLAMESDNTMIRVRKFEQEEMRTAEYLCSNPFNVTEELESRAAKEDWDISSIITRDLTRSLNGKEVQDLSVRLEGISSTRSNMEEAHQRLFQSYPVSPMTPCLPPYSSLSQGYVAPSTQSFEPMNITSPSFMECSH
uniref:Homeodomain transcription factor bW n=1 Tax=Malassezia sympodialis TaxID=76777 RepID=L7SZM9_MALSM|nr:homeodomain transcription factor bW [Malassezia sympodialis]